MEKLTDGKIIIEESASELLPKKDGNTEFWKTKFTVRECDDGFHYLDIDQEFSVLDSSEEPYCDSVSLNSIEMVQLFQILKEIYNE